jgi:hypothetical protein
MSSVKIEYAVEMICTVIPKDDARRSQFKELMDEYVSMIKNGETTLPKPNTGDSKVDALATQVLNSMLNEQDNFVDAPSTKGYGRRGYYWNHPSWWGYWNNRWSPYYWWNGYSGYSYIGARSKRGSNPVASVLGEADIHTLNMTCDADRLCNLSVQFTKAPIVSQVVQDDEFEIL